MTLKDYIKKFQLSLLTKFEKKGNESFAKNLRVFVYPVIIITSFIVYTITFNSINNQKNENEKNLENFFNSEEFTNVKRSFFENLKSPYIEFTYNIENNDSIGKILKKFKVSDIEIQNENLAISLFTRNQDSLKKIACPFPNHSHLVRQLSGILLKSLSFGFR